MPYVDSKTGDIVARVVYDGAAEAGKTTSLQVINRVVGTTRGSELSSPGSNGRKTEFFDWMDFAGGYLDGRRLRLQLITVPGQNEVQHRRRVLLETADAIIFVADSRPGRASQNRESFSLTRALQQKALPPIGVVVQANKQDAVGALSLAEVAAQLELPASVPLVGANALSGRGLTQAFVLAVRMATDRAREVLCAGGEQAIPDDLRSAEQMLSLMLKQEAGFEGVGTLAPLAGTELTSAASDECWLSLLGKDAAVRVDLPPLPAAVEVPAGHVWPSVPGRGFLSAAVSGVRTVLCRAYNDEEVLCVSSSEGWLMYSFPQDIFPSEAIARDALMQTARSCLGNQAWMEPERAVVLFPDHEGWRLWCVVHDRPSLSETLARAAGARNEARLLSALEAVTLAETQREGAPLEGDFEHYISLENLTVHGNQAILQILRGMPESPPEASLRTQATELITSIWPERTASSLRD